MRGEDDSLPGFDGEESDPAITTPPGGRRVSDAELSGLVAELNVLARTHQGMDLAMRVGLLYEEWKGFGLRVSFRRLGAHPGALILRSRLTTYVKVEQQSRILGPELVEELGLSMHVALLPVSCDDRKIDLAVSAVNEQWTLDELTAAVAESSGRPIHRARVSRLTERVAETAASLRKSSVRDSLDGFDEEEGERLAAQLEEATSAIVRRLRGVPETPPDDVGRDSGSFRPI